MSAERSHIIITLIFLLSFFYAFTRYVILGPVSAVQIPLFIMNKAISLSGLVLIVMSFTIEGDRISKIRLGETGFLFTVAHIVLSLLLINEDYFLKFFDAGEYNLTGGLTLLFGISAFVLLLVIRRSFKANLQAVLTQKYRFLLKISLLSFLAAHVAVMGWEGWLTPLNWYGYFPPITLISFFIAIGGLIKIVIRYYNK